MEGPIAARFTAARLPPPHPIASLAWKPQPIELHLICTDLLLVRVEGRRAKKSLVIREVKWELEIEVGKINLVGREKAKKKTTGLEVLLLLLSHTHLASPFPPAQTSSF